MDSRQVLMSLQWYSFAVYPTQGSDIYLHCETEDGTTHKFFKVRQFNAVCFDFKKIVQKYLTNQCWKFSWLPASIIEKEL